MSTRKSTNKAATDSPVSTCSDTSSTRSTMTRSSVQTPVNESDPLDTSMTIDTKRPRRTNVRTPTTPTNSIKKKSDESPDTISPGNGDADVVDDKSTKSPSDDTKSEDGKKTTDGLTESPVRAARKRKVFDKTPIVTRKSAMNLANNSRRVLRDRRSSIGKGENVENESKRRAAKKSTSLTPEPPTSLKRKRENLTKVDDKEDAKKGEKMIKLEPIDVEESSNQMPIELKEEDKLKLLVEETDSKDDELIEVLEIKQEIDEDTEEISVDEFAVKEQKEKAERVEADAKPEEDSFKLVEEPKDEEKLNDGVILNALEEEKDLKKFALGEDQKDPKTEPEISQTETATDPEKTVVVRKEEVKKEEDAKYEAYERPRRARTKRLTETPPTPAKRGGKKTDDTPETKAKGGRRNQSKSLPSDTSKSEGSGSDPAVVETKAIETPEVEDKNVAQESINGVEQPLIVDTSSSAPVVEKELPEANSDESSEKAASLSPELVSEGVNVMSVKQFYKKPEFLENNLGIEKDPKLGEIVQKAEKIKDESNSPEDIQMPCNSAEVGVEKPGESIECSPDCSGDSLKEGERLILDDSTEEDVSSSTITNIVETKADEVVTCAVEEDSIQIATEDSEMTKLKVDDDEKEKKEEEFISNNASVAGDVDALQTNCDKNSSNSAVVTDDVDVVGEKCVRGDNDDIKDKIACNKSSIEEIDVSNDRQEKIEDCVQEEVEIETCESSSIVEEKEDAIEIPEQMLMEVDSKEDPAEVETDIGQVKVDDDKSTTAKMDESEAKELEVEHQEELVDAMVVDELVDAMVVDEINDNKENVAEDVAAQNFNENIKNCVNTPKKVRICPVCIFPPNVEVLHRNLDRSFLIGCWGGGDKHGQLGAHDFNEFTQTLRKSS